MMIMQSRLDTFLRHMTARPVTPLVIGIGNGIGNGIVNGIVSGSKKTDPAHHAIPMLKQTLKQTSKQTLNQSLNQTMNQALNQTMNQTLKPIEAYTDGACPANGRGATIAGAGVAFPDHPGLNVSETILEKPTNNRAELLAILRATEVADASIDPTGRQTLRVFTDSMLCVNTFTKWVAGWKKNGWRKRDGAPVLNAELIKAIDARMARRRIEFKHVRAHTGRGDRDSQFNALADELAVKAATGQHAPR